METLKVSVEPLELTTCNLIYFILKLFNVKYACLSLSLKFVEPYIEELIVKYAEPSTEPLTT